MNYYIISETEDGINIDGPMDREQLLREIAELNDEDIRPECRGKFLEEFPGVSQGVFKDFEKRPKEDRDRQHVVIIKGEVVVPRPVERVIEYEV